MLANSNAQKHTSEQISEDGSLTATELDQESQETKHSFRTWRRSRPFIAGLLLICAGAVIVAPAYMTLEILDLLVVISTISGVSTLLIGALLIMFGIGAWLKPATAPYLGVLSIIIGVIALPTSNFGGFLLGTGLAIVGGALALAWEPRDRPKSRRKRNRKRAKNKEIGVDEERIEESDSTEDDGGEQDSTESITRKWKAPSRSVISVITGALCIVGGGVSLSGGGTPAVAQDSQHLDFVGETSSVTADEIVVSGNARVGLVDVQTQQGTVRMIELSGNKVAVDNIRFGLPGESGESILGTGPGEISTLTGNPAVLRTRTLTATPAVNGVPTIPVSVHADGNLKEIDAQLQALGLTSAGVPDPIMDHISLKDAHLDALGVQAEELDAPGVSLIASDRR